MLTLSLRYTRYVLAALSSVALLLEHPISSN